MTSRTLWLATLGSAAFTVAMAAIVNVRTGSVAFGAPDDMTGMMLTAALEQPADNDGPPDGPDGGHKGGAGGREGPRDHDGMRRGGMGMGGGMGGPSGPGGPGGGPRDFRAPSPDMMGRYMDLVQRYGEIAKDPSLAGVSAVITANDLLRAKGHEAGIAYFKKLLPEVKDATVQRAIRLMLIDLYRRAQQNDLALQELEALIRNAPATAPADHAH